MQSLQLLYSFEFVGLGVLDEMPLVQDDELEVKTLEEGILLLDHRVTGDEELRAFRVFGGLGDLLGLVKDGHVADGFRKVFFVLVRPMLH